ncbi:AAA family ATPase [Brachyspira pilosicoli]|uniref:Dethiobiotin synthase n=1 Tax=Brachyspira pilosicoli TaxID=52584 RepID=A0A5C8FBS0_BRAPL|nr:AAA family ATPase [Brachyspira pilosicoli]TXJ47416.1 dethiobiotin synthase [Brachyspira pilosicoli]
MKIFYIISNKKHSGKTYLASNIVESIKILGKSVCYYKPFVMEVKDNKLFDCEYIKNTTTLNASDIFVSYATNGNLSPIHSINTKIDERDVTDLIDECKKTYNYMVLESLCLYDPIKENYNFLDLITDIERENEIQIIPLIEYDTNVIHSSLEQVELFHQRGFKIPFTVINIKKDVFVQNEVIEYIRNQISPIKLHTTIFDNFAESKKISEIKYPNIIMQLIK